MVEKYHRLSFYIKITLGKLGRVSIWMKLIGTAAHQQKESAYKLRSNPQNPSHSHQEEEAEDEWKWHRVSIETHQWHQEHYPWYHIGASSLSMTAYD